MNKIKNKQYVCICLAYFHLIIGPYQVNCLRLSIVFTWKSSTSCVIEVFIEKQPDLAVEILGFVVGDLCLNHQIFSGLHHFSHLCMWTNTDAHYLLSVTLLLYTTHSDLLFSVSYTFVIMINLQLGVPVSCIIVTGFESWLHQWTPQEAPSNGSSYRHPLQLYSGHLALFQGTQKASANFKLSTSSQAIILQAMVNKTAWYWHENRLKIIEREQKPQK